MPYTVMMPGRWGGKIEIYVELDSNLNQYKFKSRGDLVNN